MSDYYMPGPVDLLMEICQLGFVLLIGFIVYDLARTGWQKIDAWRWKRRLAKWERQSYHR